MCNRGASQSGKSPLGEMSGRETISQRNVRSGNCPNTGKVTVETVGNIDARSNLLEKGFNLRQIIKTIFETSLEIQH